MSVTPEEKLGQVKAQEMETFLRKHQGEKHIVCLQDFPDPDAISAAVLHRLIALRFDIESDIVYAGRISHQQNIALVKLLNLDLIRYSETLDLSQYVGSIFIDNQGTTTSLTKPLEELGIPPLAVVDHHERQDRLKPEFCDIRKTGSTATIYVDYMRHGLFEFEKSEPDHVNCATALMVGIFSDTRSMIRGKEEDFLAAAFLCDYVDHARLEEILYQSRSKRVMDIIQKALENRIVKDNYSISGIGYLRLEDRDAIPQAADFLLTEENVHTAIVYGIVIEQQREMLSGSFRTSKITLDPDEFLKETFGRDVNGNFYGGGREEAGGFEIPIGFLSGGMRDEVYMKRKWEVYDQQVKQKIFRKILGGIDQEGE
ncbi:MAG: bifunctional oligoribonuclease/PAP phosphatase NrnA [Nitrospinota bacterium]|nr:MAG: bifunctional oligoribonuclease/PAP phosphatase NrnA [Nitrospinota bacterium]